MMFPGAYWVLWVTRYETPSPMTQPRSIRCQLVSLQKKIPHTVTLLCYLKLEALWHQVQKSSAALHCNSWIWSFHNNIYYHQIIRPVLKLRYMLRFTKEVQKCILSDLFTQKSTFVESLFPLIESGSHRKLHYWEFVSLKSILAWLLSVLASRTISICDRTFMTARERKCSQFRDTHTHIHTPLVPIKVCFMSLQY